MRMDELEVDVVFNADQTQVLFDHVPRPTLAAGEVKTVLIRTSGKDKEKFTCMLLGDSLGYKYALFLLLKTSPSTHGEKALEKTHLRHGYGSRL